MKRITIRDVAREAGVSISTVSNALNQTGITSEKTRKHVLEVANRLQYVPNVSGQSLRMKRKKAIGLFVFEMAGAYYAELADSMHHECEKNGYELYIFITKDQKTVLQKCLGGELNGAVLDMDITEETLKRLEAAAFPTVVINEELSGNYRASVAFNSFRAGKDVTEYLVGLGHKKFMYAAGPGNNFDSVMREKGMNSVLEQHGIPTESVIQLRGLFSREVARRSMTEYLKSGKELPDAIFASNDLSAYGCMEALRDAGIRVPEDISIAGCDDNQLCEICTPSLTTVKTNFEQQGVVAIRLLYKFFNGIVKGTVIRMDGTLIVRNSCQRKA